MDNKIWFRSATIEDLDLLKYWDEQPHVIEAGVDEDWGWEKDLAHESPHYQSLIAMLGDKSIGVVQIIDPAQEETHYWGEDVEENLRAIDIWIGEPDMLNKGYGTQMMNLALERCFTQPEVKAVIIDPLVSNVNAIRFYKRIGFEFVEYRTFGKDDCYVMRLERESFKI